MHKAIQTLHDAGIPTGSYIAAVQYLNERGTLTEDEYFDRINELLDGHNLVNLPNDDIAEHRPRYAYLYFVQELIRASFSSDSFDTLNVWRDALKRAETFIRGNSYIFAKAEDDEPKLDATGKPKPKKGAKKELAKKVYAEKIDGKGLTRKDAIAILADEVGMTPAGASTYYANLKAGRL